MFVPTGLHVIFNSHIGEWKGTQQQHACFADFKNIRIGTIEEKKNFVPKNNLSKTSQQIWSITEWDCTIMSQSYNLPVGLIIIVLHFN